MNEFGKVFIKFLIWPSIILSPYSSIELIFALKRFEKSFGFEAYC
jgi:hypothetical protein